MKVEDGLVQIPPINLVVIIVISITFGFAIASFMRIKAKARIWSLDTFVMLLSLVILVASFVLQAVGKLEAFGAASISTFSSIIFSWLLTKASNKSDFKLQEQALAKKSYRHINYIESAARTAEKTINQYISGPEEEVDAKTKLILSRAMDDIGYISGGISTCKMDWFDLLSEEDQQKTTEGYEPDQVVNTDSINLNQEDA
ncbi:hypothetical protein OBV_24920 [Oscillibacter valericigenes Sjm18-20]|nr:hypothetical protein OBV_24920 [Oscillibacter valericigenes Sjm18-20]